MHNKLSSPNDRSHVIIAESIMMNDSDDKQNPINSIQKNFKQTTAISNFDTNIFVKEVVFVLYDDDKDHLCKKNFITSLFLDDVITCYTEEVCSIFITEFKKKKKITIFIQIFRNENSNSVLEIFKSTIICIRLANMIFP